MWYYGKSVIRAHSKNGSQMAWAIISGLLNNAWLRVTPASADGVTNVFIILSTALANNRLVDVLVVNGEITQATLQ
jgi:hypothetical protein